jgi:hypothetical protein
MRRRQQRQRPRRRCLGSGADFVCASVVAGAGPIRASSVVGQRAWWRHVCAFSVLPQLRGIANRLRAGEAGALACWARAYGALPRRYTPVYAFDTAGMSGDLLSTGIPIGGCLSDRAHDGGREAGKKDGVTYLRLARTAFFAGLSSADTGVVRRPRKHPRRGVQRTGAAPLA